MPDLAGPRKVPVPHFGSRVNTRAHVRAHERTHRTHTVDVASFIAGLQRLRGRRSSSGRSPPKLHQASADSHRGGLCSGSTLTFTHFSRVFRSLFWGGSREHARQPAAPPPGRPGTADKAATYHFQMHFIFIHRLQSGTEEQRDG